MEGWRVLWRVIVLPFSPFAALGYLAASGALAFGFGAPLWDDRQQTFTLVNVLVAIAWGVIVGLLRGDDGGNDGSDRPAPLPAAGRRAWRPPAGPSRKPSADGRRSRVRR